MCGNSEAKINKLLCLLFLYNRMHNVCHGLSFFFFVPSPPVDLRLRVDFRNAVAGPPHPPPPASSPFISTTTRALFGDHYYSPSARLSQICSRAEGSFFWYRAPKKMAGSVNFGPNSFFGGLDFFPRPPPFGPPGKEIRGPKVCGSVRKVCGKCAEISKMGHFATEYLTNLNA